MLKKIVAGLLCSCMLFAVTACGTKKINEADYPKTTVAGLLNLYIKNKYEGTEWENIRVKPEDCKEIYFTYEKETSFFSYSVECGNGLKMKFLPQLEKDYTVKDNFQSEKLFDSLEKQIKEEYFPETEIEIVANYVGGGASYKKQLFLEDFVPDDGSMIQFLAKQENPLLVDFALFVLQPENTTDEEFFSPVERLDKDCDQSFEAFAMNEQDFNHVANLVKEGLDVPIQSVGATAEEALLDSLYRGIYRFEKLRNLYNISWAYCEKDVLQDKKNEKRITAVEYPIAPGVTFTYFEKSPETSSRFLSFKQGIPLEEVLDENYKSFAIDKEFEEAELAPDKWGEDMASRFFPISEEIQYTGSTEGFYGFEIRIDRKELYSAYPFTQYSGDELFAWVYYPSTEEWDTQIPEPSAYKPELNVYHFNYFDDITAVQQMNIFVAIDTPVVK